MHAPTAPDLLKAIRSGMTGMRALSDGGYGKDASKLAFPIGTVTTAVSSPPAEWLEEKIPIPIVPGWSILRSRLDQPGGDAAERLYELASRVVVNGPDTVLKDIPQARFGDLFTVDRQEIESAPASSCSPAAPPTN